ncbi:MAG: hypothetical protein UT50_C0010G0018 [Candidatus Moranbacteria bacterium GW2011_GWA2_39_41]|nr:MAG: hypothetical protein UT50_C0010G0018 [Candidatus Moranbacteria bacterium GW2011_GWA2_39_41]
MITLVLLALYGIIILTFLIVSFFIIYHLVTYSINSELKIIMLFLFVVVTAGLLISNLALFFSIDWNNLIADFLP